MYLHIHVHIQIHIHIHRSDIHVDMSMLVFIVVSANPGWRVGHLGPAWNLPWKPSGPPLDNPGPPGPPALDLLSACPEVWTAFYEAARSEAACFHVVHILPRNLLDSPAPTLPPLLNSFC